jgi:D-alanyl-D-alanine carboxypeptidase
MSGTRAEARLRQLVRALNSGDATELTAFLAKAWRAVAPARSARFPGGVPADVVAARMLASVRSTGPLEIRSVERDGQAGVRCLVVAPLVRQWREIRLAISEPPAELITAFADIPARDPGWQPVHGGPAERARAASAFLGELTAADVFSGVIRVADRGQVLFEQACGLSDQHERLPNRVGTAFNVGSMIKMFTAVCVGQLVQQGRLGLDDLVATRLPGFRPDIAGRITIRQLLSHTSGLGDIFNARYFSGARNTVNTVADYVDLFRDDPLESEPGSRFRYSNAGYVLLGAIIEETTGSSYYDHVARCVFDRAGMRATGFPAADEVRPGIAIGYTSLASSVPAAAVRQPNTDTLPHRGCPAGGGYSTTADLSSFADAMLSHALLGAEMTTVLLTPQPPGTGGPGVPYGLGFSVETIAGVSSFGHNGGAPGISALLDVFPRSGRSLAVLSNYDNGAMNIWSELRRIFWPADSG